VSLSFARHDEDGDGELDVNEAQGVFEATGLDPALFDDIDTSKDGKISLGEWEGAENVHPPLALKLTTFSGLVEYHPMESADFGADFRHDGESNRLTSAGKILDTGGSIQLNFILRNVVLRHASVLPI